MVCAASACNLYNDDLLGRAEGDDGSSGGTGGGSTDSDGGTTGGGSPSGGGAPPGNGGSGGEGETGGAAGDGGNGDGGRDTGGAGGSGGGDTGGGGGGTGGSGGTPTVYLGLVDDFNESTPTPNYSNMPFYGTWSRYEQAGATWTAGSVTLMIQPRPDDADDGALHVDATDLDDWGVGVFVTLKNGGAVDLSDATGIRFAALSMNDETVLKVAIADVHSHRNNCLAVNDGEDCDRHMKTVTSFALSDDWTVFELPIADFVDKIIDGVNDRGADLDITQVFALHFQMDPDDEVADFYLDDLEIY